MQLNQRFVFRILPPGTSISLFPDVLCHYKDQAKRCGAYLGLIKLLILLDNKSCWRLPDADIPFSRSRIFWHCDHKLA